MKYMNEKEVLRLCRILNKGFGEIASTTTSIIFISIAVAKISLGKVRDKFGLALTLCIAFVANISGIILLLTAKSVINYYIFAVTKKMLKFAHIRNNTLKI